MARLVERSLSEKMMFRQSVDQQAGTRAMRVEPVTEFLRSSLAFFTAGRESLVPFFPEQARPSAC